MSNTTAIEVFTFPFTNQNVRITDQNGDPWFIAKDVCEILGFDHAPSAVRALDEDERNTVRISHGNRGNPNATIINESGLYSLILKSRKEEAKRFKKWVTSEVLPSLRKKGTYALPAAGPVFAIPQTLAEALEFAAKQVREKEALAAENQILAPKAKLYDQYMDVDGTLNLTSAAKVLGFTSGRALGMYLRETLGWLFLDTTQVIPKAHVIEKGFMTTKAWSMIDRQKSGVQGRITAKGMD